MMNLVDQKDSLNKEILEKKLAAVNQTSTFRKIFKYNNPVSFVYIGLFCSLVLGTVNPILGVCLAKLITVMTIPREVVEYDMMKDYDDYIRTNVDKWCFVILAMGFVNLIFGFVNKYLFGYLGENVTIQMRKDLYESIIRKHVGWFDDKRNAPAILTSCMAQDTAMINGVASESLATIFESAFALLVGVGIGFYYCWQLSLVCLGCAPFMAIGGALEAAYRKKMA